MDHRVLYWVVRAMNGLNQCDNSRLSAVIVSEWNRFLTVFCFRGGMGRIMASEPKANKLRRGAAQGAPFRRPRVANDLIATLRSIATALVWIVLPTVAVAQDSPDYYRANCMNCHTIGDGRLTGPDLKDVTKRRDAEWLIGFLQNPKAVVESGDAYAAKLVEESRGVVMPIAPGMTRYRAEQLIKLIEAESKLDKSQFKVIRISSKPFNEKDRATGHDIFVGTHRLKNGGTACIGCHNMYDLTALGGGRLGPDLTHVYERLKGRKSVSAWLRAPATATMQPIFKQHPLEAGEIHALTAYFEAAAQHSETDASVSRIALLLMGLAAAAGVVFVFDVIWKGRFRSVRRALVEASLRRGH